MRQDLIKKLVTLTDEELSQIYMRVFNSADGQLVLEDLRQRCFYYIPTLGPQQEANEGARNVVMNIESRLQPIEPQTKQED